MRFSPSLAGRRTDTGLAPLNGNKTVNPFSWLAEMMDLKKEQNFFEGRVTEYQKSAAMKVAHDDDL